MNMDFFMNQILPWVFTVVVIPGLGVLTIYLVALIRQKKEEVKNKIKDQLAAKYIGMLFDVVEKCVVVTNNTYVNALKKEGKFDKEAQLTAFTMTKEAVLAMITEEAATFLSTYYGDLTEAINQIIEATVVTAYNREGDV